MRHNNRSCCSICSMMISVAHINNCSFVWYVEDRWLYYGTCVCVRERHYYGSIHTYHSKVICPPHTKQMSSYWCMQHKSSWYRLNSNFCYCDASPMTRNVFMLQFLFCCVGRTLFHHSSIYVAHKCPRLTSPIFLKKTDCITPPCNGLSVSC